MRKSFDGLSGLVSEVFDADLLTGDLFVFVNRRRDRIKLLWWDHDGLGLFYKRLERGGFQVPKRDQDGVELDAAELAMLLSGIDPGARRRKRYRRADRAD
jgi:transposase